MDKINRHIKAGAIAGLLFPALGSVWVITSAPSWRPVNLLITIIILGLLVGSVFGALILGLEKLISKKLWLIFSILPALVAGLFIAAIALSAQ